MSARHEAAARVTLVWRSNGAVGAEAQTARLGDLLTVTVSLHPNPPRSGDNRIDLTLTNAAGAPIDGAKLALVSDMPAMGAMPEMRDSGEVKPRGSGRYAITYPLAMNGDWSLPLDRRAGTTPRSAEDEGRDRAARGGVEERPAADKPSPSSRRRASSSSA